ncbi:MAG TPA: J domain-containing protein, partial [Desulfobacterales bacterium]|nr:J domain-containing protein [Desulfobacterales bacterium]
MPVYYYRYRSNGGPGCSGCLFVLLLVMLATGGLPFVFQFLGFLVSFFLVGLLFLVVAFYAFGYYVRRQIAAYERSQTEVHQRFVTLLIHILVHVARTDGTVSRAETRIITDFFRQHLGYDQQRIYWVKEVIKQAMDSSAPLDDLLHEFKNTFAYEPRLILLELVLRIVATKPEPPPAELELARRIANYLDISY